MQVSLTTDGWHRRLQEWTFNDVELFDNLCPYFWLTVFCLVTSPIVLGWRVTMFGLDRTGDVLVWGLSYLLSPFGIAGQWLANRFDPTKAWRSRRHIKKMSDSLVYHYWLIVKKMEDKPEWKGTWGHEHKAKKILDAWKAFFSDWEERLDRIVKEQAELAKQSMEKTLSSDEDSRRRAAARRKFYLKLATITQAVFKPIFVGLLIIVAVGAVGGGVYGIYWVLMNALMTLLKVLGVIAGIIAGSAIIWVTVSWFSSHKWFGFGNFMGRVGDFCFDNRMWPALGKGIGKLVSPLGIFALYVKAVLDNNCPAIEWDKTDS